jgi:hypothetical protein
MENSGIRVSRQVAAKTGERDKWGIGELIGADVAEVFFRIGAREQALVSDNRIGR